MTRLVIVGGSDAGVEAALAARRQDPNLEVELLLDDAYLNFSICGLPFLVSGEVDDWHDLAHRSATAIEGEGVGVLPGHHVTELDLATRSLTVEVGGGVTSIDFDRLVLTTGARPSVPASLSIESPGVRVVHTMGDGIGVRRDLDDGQPRDAVIVGSGYIGVEMADALTRRGVTVTLTGRSRSALPSVSESFGRLIEAELGRNGVTIANERSAVAIERRGSRTTVTFDDGESLEADLVVLATGVRPNSELAAHAGIATGVAGAITVDRGMRTTVAGVFAAGDCVETHHAVFDGPAYLPLGTTAHKQGRVAGTNAAGGDARFAGSVGTQVVKVFDLAAARTGLSEIEARSAGSDATTVSVVVPDHKRYYPGARDLHIGLIADAGGRLLGAEIVGDWRAGVAKRIDILAAAIQHGWPVSALLELDLSYTPPLGSPWDAVQLAADAWVRSSQTHADMA